jgi:hypothetical protein
MFKIKYQINIVLTFKAERIIRAVYDYKGKNEGLLSMKLRLKDLYNNLKQSKEKLVTRSRINYLQ